jgi:hypothetical protein
MQLFIIYVLSEQLQGNFWQHRADIGNYITDKHNINSRVIYRKTIMQNAKQTIEDDR